MTCAQGLLRLLWGGPKLECYGTDGNNATELLQSVEVNFSDKQKFTREVDQFFQRSLSYLHK